MGSIPQNEETILITGISGFVAAWIAHTFLDAGYNVRGSVRSEKSIEGIKKTHAKHANRLSFVRLMRSTRPSRASRGLSTQPIRSS
jgi:nucleoside-diphosphate-sugar epimerase